MVVHCIEAWLCTVSRHGLCTVSRHALGTAASRHALGTAASRHNCSKVTFALGLDRYVSFRRACETFKPICMYATYTSNVCTAAAHSIESLVHHTSNCKRNYVSCTRFKIRHTPKETFSNKLAMFCFCNSGARKWYFIPAASGPPQRNGHFYREEFQADSWLVIGRIVTRPRAVERRGIIV